MIVNDVGLFCSFGRRVKTRLGERTEENNSYSRQVERSVIVTVVEVTICVRGVRSYYGEEKKTNGRRGDRTRYKRRTNNESSLSLNARTTTTTETHTRQRPEPVCYKPVVVVVVRAYEGRAARGG